MKLKTPIFRAYLQETAQALFSMLFNFSGLIAGGLVASYFDLFEKIPWALILYPGILSIRGAIGGLMSGRISTALHLGTIKPSFFNNTKDAAILFNTATLLTLVSSLMMWLINTIFSMTFLGASVQDVPQILMVLLATMGISVIFISPFTFFISITSYRRGIDPDILVYPVVSTMSDVVITAIYIGVLSIVVNLPGSNWLIIGIINIIFLLFVAWSIRNIIHERDFRQTVKEFSITAFLVSIIVNISGYALSKISESIGRRSDIYMIYPACIDTVGDVGSIIGSTATTKMALGLMSTKFSDIRFHIKEITSAWIASLIMFWTYAVASSYFYATGDLSKLLIIVSLAHVLVVPSIVVISMFTAIITRKRGLDPDNFIIPIETSISDGLTTIALMVVLSVIV